jgi:hypothetical protein
MGQESKRRQTANLEGEANEEHYVNELNSQQNASILNRGESFGFLCSGSLQYL